MTGPELHEVDPGLLAVLRDAGDKWGPYGVLRTAVKLWPDAADLHQKPSREALTAAESILSLLRYRRIVDTPRNRADVERALALVQYALGYRTMHPGPFPPVDLDERRRHGVEIPWQHTHPPLDACTPSCPRWEALQAEKRAAAAAENPPMVQQPDGSWAPAESLPYQGRVAKVEQWARRRGWNHAADWLAAWDERNLGR